MVSSLSFNFYLSSASKFSFKFSPTPSKSDIKEQAQGLFNCFQSLQLLQQYLQLGFKQLSQLIASVLLPFTNFQHLKPLLTLFSGLKVEVDNESLQGPVVSDSFFNFLSVLFLPLQWVIETDFWYIEQHDDPSNQSYSMTAFCHFLILLVNLSLLLQQMNFPIGRPCYLQLIMLKY